MTDTTCHHTVIIACAGASRRWRSGISKHLVTVDGVPIMHRTVQASITSGADAVYVVANEKDRHTHQVTSYWLDHVQLITPENDEKYLDLNKIVSAKRVWPENGQVTILFGDVYYSDDAFNTIFTNPTETWNWFCRMEKSDITGCIYGEGFGLSFCMDMADQIEEAVRNVADTCRREVIQRAQGWELARYLGGAREKQISKHVSYPGFIEIDDETEDFDKASDYNTWLRMLPHHTT